MRRAFLLAIVVAILILSPRAIAPTDTDYFPGTQVIDKGTQTGGSFPGDVDDSNDIRVTYQEADQVVTTDLVVDSQNIDLGTQFSGTFPGDVTSSNNAYITYREANTGGAGGFPTVVGSALSSRATNAIADTVVLPASVASGDLIIILHFSDSPALSATVPSPWVEIKDVLYVSVATVFVAYLIASGGETQVIVTKAVTERFSAIAIRISAASWHGTTPPEISTGVTGTSTLPDPDSLDPAGWGTENTMWIAVMAMDDSAGTNTVSVYPYASNNLKATGVSSAGNGAIATTESAVASINPGTFTITSDEWWAGTMAVRPAAAPPNYQLQVRYNWVTETCADTRRLRVEGHHTAGENFLVQTVDSTEVTWTTRLTITATSDPNVYQTFDIDADTWDSGNPNVRFLGGTESSDTTLDDLILDHVQFLCVPPADYEAQWKYSWTGVPTAGTAWRLFVEGLQLTNAETLEVRIFAADDVALSGIVCSIVSTTESELDCGLLTTDQRDAGSPDIQFRDANQAAEGLQSSWGLDRVRIRVTDGDPTISSRTNTPASGTSLTAFDFAAVYTDDVTCPASLFDVSFNSGGSWTALTATDGDANCTDGKAYNLVPDQAGFCPGTRTYRFRASDGVNPTVTDGSDVTFTVTNIAPSVTPDLATETTPVGTAYVRAFAHNDNDITIGCQTATWTVPVGPPGCSISSGGLLTCDGTLAVGTYGITVRAGDGTASSDESFVLEVAAASEDPEFQFFVRAMFSCTYDTFSTLVCVDRSMVADPNVEIVSRMWYVDGRPAGSGRTLEVSSFRLAAPWEGGFWATDDTRIALTVQTRLGASSTCDIRTARNVGTPCFAIEPIDNATRSVGFLLIGVRLLAQVWRRE